MSQSKEDQDKVEALKKSILARGDHTERNSKRAKHKKKRSGRKNTK